MERDILVDGYNVIKKNAMFQMLEMKNLAIARDTLIKLLKNRYRYTPLRVTVVFDGDGTYEQVSYNEHICIIFSRYGETADCVIARLATKAYINGREATVYSDDLEVQQSVTEQGGNKHTTHQLTKHLNAPPRNVEARSKHRQTMKHAYGLDPTAKWKDDDDALPDTRRGKSKKPRKHR